MSVELYNWHEVGFNPTFDVKAMTVACPCGCGALTHIPFRGRLQAHVWPDQLRFTFKSRIAQILVGFLFRLKSPKALLVLIEFTNGIRLQCAPSKLHRGKGGDFATDRPCDWKEIR